MDKLQHIDDLLKASAQQLATDAVGDSDWLSVEKKLRRRKNRFYALRFFLALVLVSAGMLLWQPFGADPIANENTSTQEFQSAELPGDKVVDAVETPSTTTPNNQDLADAQLSSNDLHSDYNAAKSQNIGADPNPELISGLTPQNSTDPVAEPIIRLAQDLTHEDEPATENQAETNAAPDQVLENTTGEEKEFPTENTDIANDIAGPTVANDSASANSPKGNKGSSSTPIRQAFIPYTEIGIAFTPGWSNKNTSENSAFAGLINRQYYNKVGPSESSGFTNSAGLVIHRHLNRFLYAASGLYVSQRSEYVNYNYTIDESPNVVEDPSGKRIEGYIPRLPSQYEDVKYNGSNSYHFIEIPFNLGYKQNISPKFELRGQVGLSYLHLLQTSGKKADYTYLELADLGDFSWNQHLLATNVRTGLYFNYNKLVIGAEPSLSVSLNSLSDKNAAIKVKPYNYGFNLIAGFKLNKK